MKYQHFLLFILMQAIPISPMQSSALKLLKKYASAAKQLLLTTTISSMAFLDLHNSIKKTAKLPDAHPVIKEFVLKSLQPLGSSYFQSISIKTISGKRCDFGASSHNTIILGDPQNIQHIIENSKPHSYEILRLQGMIQHEGGHVKYNHYCKDKMFAGFMAVFFANLLYKKYLTQAFILGLTAKPFLILLGNFHERQADNTIESDPLLLKAVAKEYKNDAIDYDHYATTWFKLNDPHPHPLKRAQRFEERAHANFS